MLPNTTLLSIGFIAITVVCVFWINAALKASKWQLPIIGIWLAITAGLSLAGFFDDYKVVPPRFPLLVLPALVFTIIYPFTAKGKAAIAKANVEHLTLMHSIRIVVEAVFLLQLYKLGYLNEIATFHGQNYDIIPGLTAIPIWWLYCRKKLISKHIFLLWNLASFAVLLFTISRVIISSPLLYDEFMTTGNPSIGVFHFSFVWLPAFVAPLMLFSHVLVFHKYKGLR